MGNALEFEKMVEFVQEHQITPVVSQVFNGLDSIEEAFDSIKKGSQFGKLVVSLITGTKL
jgi:hypothetical protein